MNQKIKVFNLTEEQVEMVRDTIREYSLEYAWRYPIEYKEKFAILMMMFGLDEDEIQWMKKYN